MRKRFTLAEAQSLIPHVERLLREAVDLKLSLADAEQTMQTIIERIMMLGGSVVNRDAAVEARSRREASVEMLRHSIEQVQACGCVVKDLEMGLVDFPTLLRGEEVYLCWKLGEPQIEFWHGVDEGFRGRKAIDQDFRDHHRGDRAQ